MTVPSASADDDATIPRATRRRGGNALPDGTRLAEFELRSVVGEGGFGIVYLAWDHSLQRQVAIKEYMPASLASRTQTSFVSPLSDKLAQTFALGLRSFINEAHLLASFDHPSLLKVYRFWEDNGTAYMVMPFYKGKTLKRALSELQASPEESWLLRQLGPLLDALEVMHQGHCYHRDIAPDNILLLEDGRPLLLDFGAARRVIGDATQALTAFLKPGFAPVEQYAEMPSMKQGPWTDLYALASVGHCAIVGHTPPESVARLVNDTMVPLARVGAGRYSDRFLRALDHALAVRPHERPQSAVEMRSELGILDRRGRSRAREIPTTPQPLEPIAADIAQDDERTRPPLRVTALVRAPEPAAPPPATMLPAERARAALAAPPERRRTAAGLAPLWWAAGAGAVLLAGGLWWWAGAPGAGVASNPAGSPTVPGAERGASPAPQPTTAAPAAANIETVAPPATALPATTAPKDDGLVDTPAAALPRAAEPSPARTEESEPRTPAVAARPTPRKNSQNARCTEIIARVSLGEPLSAEDQAMLKGECRK